MALLLVFCFLFWCFFFFTRVHNSLLLVICGNMSAKRFLGEMCCRVPRELCSYVTLLLLQQKVWKKWSLVAHTGFKLPNLNRGLDIPSYSYWLLTRNAPEGHPCIFMLFVGKVWQMRYSTVSALVASCYFSSSSVPCLLELGDQDSYSQVDDQEKNVHWWCHEDRSAEMWMCPAGLWMVYGLCSHTHAPFTSWLSNEFWNWACDTREFSMCVRGNEQTSLNRVHGRRVIQTLVSETLISLLPHRLKRSSFFFSHMLFVGERIII